MRRLSFSLPKLNYKALRPYLLRFALAFLLAGTQLFGRYAPFGVAVTAACGAGLAGLSAMLGCMAGAMVFLPFAPALRYAAIAVLLFSASAVFYDTRFFRFSFFSPAMAAGMTVAVSFVYVGQAGWPVAGFLQMLVEAGLAAYGCVLCRQVLKGRDSAKRLSRAEAAAPGAALRRQLEKASAAFRELYESFGRPSPSTEENPAVVFDRAAEATCRSCALCRICWEREYNNTFNALNDATPLMIQRGRALAQDFPAYFSNRCIHFPDFLAAVNSELTTLLLRRQYRLRLEESKAEAGRQYAGFSDLLSSAARHVEAFSHKPAAVRPLLYQIGSGLYPRQGQTVSGDSFSAFEGEDGCLYLMLSDGMGSGEEARKESGLIIRLLQQFLQAGVGTASALKTLNAALSLRGETGFTTIDLLAVSLATGEAVLHKYGAAPSYLRMRGQVSRITGRGLPAGLETADTPPDSTTLQLEPGSYLILQSDGVADVGSDQWLMDLLAGWQGENPQALANRILAESRQRRGAEDDGSLLVLYLAREQSSPQRV